MLLSQEVGLVVVYILRNGPEERGEMRLDKALLCVNCENSTWVWMDTRAFFSKMCEVDS
jgi:hypothetical protein